MLAAATILKKSVGRTINTFGSNKKVHTVMKHWIKYARIQFFTDLYSPV